MTRIMSLLVLCPDLQVLRLLVILATLTFRVKNILFEVTSLSSTVLVLHNSSCAAAAVSSPKLAKATQAGPGALYSTK